jgi:excinuclease ABC subunit B
VSRPVNESTYLFRASKQKDTINDASLSKEELIQEMTKEMLEAADNLEFEKAAYLRDQIKAIKS